MQAPHPPLYFGGSSEEAIDVAAETSRQVPDLGRAAGGGRREDRPRSARPRRNARAGKVRFGIRLHVIVRETANEAWAAADNLIRYVDDETVAKAQAVFARMDSVGQSRMAALHGGRRDKLEVSPNLWAGVGLVRGGAGTALVGDPETVAARMEEYAALGIDTFILSGYPHLEEAYRFAELVFPLLPLAHAQERTALSVNTGPFGETIANDIRPTGCEAGAGAAASGGLSDERRAKPSADRGYDRARYRGVGAAARPPRRLANRCGDRASCRRACCRRRGAVASPSGSCCATARCS